jgi:Skp family chaperone for outer membrane proteins
MKTLLASAALAAAVIVPTAATAQAVPPAVIAIVDVNRITAECNACKTARTALQNQITSFENRRKTLVSSLETEQKAIQAEVNALKGAEPGAALQAKAKAFQTKMQQGEQGLAAQQQTIQRNNQYVLKQILDKLNPIYGQVLQRRGANIMMDTNATLANAQSVDVTNEVLAALNTALPTIVTVAPAQAKPATPQGR